MTETPLLSWTHMGWASTDGVGTGAVVVMGTVDTVSSDGGRLELKIHTPQVSDHPGLGAQV